jgi:anti-sigma factor RsiW
LNASWLRRLFGARELTCDDIRDLSSDYVDDEISGSVGTRFRRHIDDCTDCNTFVATFRATVMTLRDIPHLAASDDLRARVMECI